MISRLKSLQGPIREVDAEIAKLDPRGQRRIERTAYLISHILPRITGDDIQRERTLMLILDYISAEFDDGIRDAATMVKRMKDGAPQHAFVLGVVETALLNLAALNQADREQDCFTTLEPRT